MFRQHRGSRTTIKGKKARKWNTLEREIGEGDNPVHDFLLKPE